MAVNKAPTNIHTPISKKIWSNKYCYRTDRGKESGIEETWQRVASAIAQSEPGPSVSSFWTDRFLDILRSFRFLPGGRILAGAGTDKQVTLFNCFVMGPIDDSIGGIFDALRQGAITMQQGGGVGYDFSSLRPKGFTTQRVGATASGPVSFMRIWDTMCETLLSTGARRGAMMATLRCDHPDIEDFITIKQDAQALRHFNLSVLISDAFMQAVKNNQSWPLVFAADKDQHSRTVCTVDATSLWQKIIRAAYDYAEPGVLFSDHINNNNNLYYREQISCTNPCGEIPLPPYGACDLGSINLTRFVDKPFAPSASFDFDALADTAKVAVRFLDNVIDLSHYPLPEQKEQAQGSRRIGLGVTGLANTFAMLGIRYGDPSSMTLAKRIISTICHTAYRISIDLARERGVFPYYEKDAYLESQFIQSLPADIQEDIATYGIRNSHWRQ
jgi:ribonucleoside-diphosphate reductase alpha chain